MSGKDLLSQDEIDALLNGIDNADSEGEPGTSAPAPEAVSVEQLAAGLDGDTALSTHQATQSGATGEQAGSGPVLDVPVTLSLELGRSQISIGDLLRLHQGSVVELDRAANAPLDLLVNGTLVARGELVTINDRCAVRVTDVVSASGRRHSPQ